MRRAAAAVLVWAAAAVAAVLALAQPAAARVVPLGAVSGIEEVEPCFSCIDTPTCSAPEPPKGTLLSLTKTARSDSFKHPVLVFPGSGGRRRLAYQTQTFNLRMRQRAWVQASGGRRLELGSFAPELSSEFVHVFVNGSVVPGSNPPLRYQSVVEFRCRQEATEDALVKVVLAAPPSGRLTDTARRLQQAAGAAAAQPPQQLTVAQQQPAVMQAAAEQPQQPAATQTIAEQPQQPAATQAAAQQPAVTQAAAQQPQQQPAVTQAAAQPSTLPAAGAAGSAQPQQPQEQPQQPQEQPAASFLYIVQTNRACGELPPCATSLDLPPADDYVIYKPPLLRQNCPGTFLSAHVCSTQDAGLDLRPNGALLTRQRWSVLPAGGGGGGGGGSELVGVPVVLQNAARSGRGCASYLGAGASRACGPGPAAPAMSPTPEQWVLEPGRAGPASRLVQQYRIRSKALVEAGCQRSYLCLREECGGGGAGSLPAAPGLEFCAPNEPGFIMDWLIRPSSIDAAQE